MRAAHAGFGAFVGLDDSAQRRFSVVVRLRDRSDQLLQPLHDHRPARHRPPI